MKIVWTGQAGLLIDTGVINIMVDPYFSNSAAIKNPRNWRRSPVKEELFHKRVDVLVITHSHIDHLDPQTLTRLLDTQIPMTVLAPYHARQEVQKLGGPHNYVLFNRGTVWTQDNAMFTAVRAEHSDRSAVGFLLHTGGQTLYITGDTLYNKEIFGDLPDGIDAVFLPINGVGNNMNLTDAKRFAQKTGARYAVPIHWGMFDEIDPTAFDLTNAVIPTLYREVMLR